MIGQTSTTGARLNALQKVMLRWSSLHPCNATHVCKIAGPLRLGDLTIAVQNTFRCHGLGIAHLSADGQSFRHETDIRPEVEVVACGDDPGSSMEEHSSRALNRSFARPAMHPFRFAAIDNGPQAHYVILACDQWVADAHAARLLLRSVLGRYLPLTIPEREERLELYPGTYREVFRRRLHGRQLVLAALRAIGQWNRNRSVWRAACRPDSQGEIEYRLYHTIPGSVARLREFARANGATLNDVLLAAFGRALAEAMPARNLRQRLAVGSIVDTRSIADEDVSRALGAFLGCCLVGSDSGMTLGLDGAARRIAARTRLSKTRHRYWDSLVNLQFINTVWPWLSTTTRNHLLRESLPMSGGISNVLVREAWMNQNRDLILDYHRGVSTWPGIPIVLTPTTFGEHLNVGVSYRIAGFTRATIDAVMEMFRDQMEHPNKASRGDEWRVPIAVQPAAKQIVPRLQVAISPVAES
jgi:hypothetical protein